MQMIYQESKGSAGFCLLHACCSAMCALFTDLPFYYLVIMGVVKCSHGRANGQRRREIEAVW